MDFETAFETSPRLTEIADSVVIRKPIICNDGATISVQASYGHHCIPKNNIGPYTHYEVGFPQDAKGACLHEERLQPYKDNTGDVYLYVPLQVITDIIHKHKGAVPWKQKR